MNTFIRVAEIWVPDADGYLLEFGGGLYGNAPEFGAASRNMCFGRGEGLPGRVWEEGCPVVLHDLQGGFFQRAAAARHAGLACAVAFPVYFGELLKAVVVLFCASPEGLSGAIEVWAGTPDASATRDLQLLDGVYGAQDAAFEAATRATRLPRGTGLPGLAWERSASVFADGLSADSGFARDAGATRLQRGLAIPCPVPTDATFVLSFLSAPTTPIAHRIESWVAAAGATAGEGGGSLTLAYGFDEAIGRLEPGSAQAGEPGEAVLEAFAGGVPRLQPATGGLGVNGASSRTAASAADGGHGTRAVIAFPVVRDGAVVETVVMHL